MQPLSFDLSAMPMLNAMQYMDALGLGKLFFISALKTFRCFLLNRG